MKSDFEGNWYSLCQIHMLNPGIRLFAIWDKRSRVSFGFSIEPRRSSNEWFMTVEPCSPPMPFEWLLKAMKPVVEAAGEGSPVDMICREGVSYYDIIAAVNDQIRNIPKSEDWVHRLMKDAKYLIKINLRKCIGPKAPFAPKIPIQSYDELVSEWGVPYIEIKMDKPPELGSPRKTFTLVEQVTKEAPFRDIPEDHAVFRGIERIVDGPSHHSKLAVGEKMTVQIRAAGKAGVYSIWRTA